MNSAFRELIEDPARSLNAPLADEGAAGRPSGKLLDRAVISWNACALPYPLELIGAFAGFLSLGLRESLKPPRLCEG